MKINERLIKIQAGAIETDRDFKNDEDVVLRVEGTVVKTQYQPNFDGTENVTYYVKGVVVEQL